MKNEVDVNKVLKLLDGKEITLMVKDGNSLQDYSQAKTS